MTDKRTTEYLKKMSEIGLSSEVKVRMRKELESFADFHAVRVPEDSRSIGEVQRISVFTLFTSSKLRIMKATLLLALMVSLGGGTSFAAQNALPGDALYPVKLHVNENVQAAFAVSANQKAELQLALLSERVEEAKQLSLEGKLQGEIEAEVLANIAAQVDKTNTASNNADAELGTNIRLAINDELSSLSTRLAVATPNIETRSMAAMDEASSATAKFDMGADADVMTMAAIGTELAGEISIAGIVEQADARLGALQKTIRTAIGMSAEVKADFETKLKAASDFVLEAQAYLKAGAETKAEESAQNAHEILGEIESSLSLMGNVEIDLNTGHIIGIDLSGNTSSGAGIVAPDIIRAGGDDAAVDSMIDVDASGSAEGSLGL